MLDGFGGLCIFKVSWTEVQAVGVKDSSKTVYIDTGNSNRFQRKKRVFPRGTTTEILFGQQDVPFLTALGNLGRSSAIMCLTKPFASPAKHQSGS